MINGKIDRDGRACSSKNDERLRGGHGVGNRSRLRADLRLVLVLLVTRRQAGIVLCLAGKCQAVRHALTVEQCKSNG
jgi:hypothetical protein